MLFLFSMLFLSMYVTIFYLFIISLQKSFMLDFFFFSYQSMDISLSFIIDFVSLGFFCCVSFITFIVFLYSVFYMEGCNDSRRFSWLVMLFVVSMFILVFSSNFFMTMVGWDGLGLVSFCLVIFYTNSSSLESGLITVFSNRVGDVFFLISFIFFYMNKSATWDFFSYSCSYLFMVFLFFGAITKSAQIPFSAWLPAAMAAPTPVSSLVHSSTLVTAGVYVMIRFNYLFNILNFSMMKIVFLMTMMIAGFCAVMENDLKKIVAMSTLSQLGMMMFILSMGLWMLSFLHMIIHAFFKSMLFLSTGSLMGQMEGTQDSRFYGNSFFSYSSFIFFITSCLSLSGFPFFIGFYSKDLIIASNSLFSGLFYYYTFILSCIFTVMYSIRLIYEAYLKLYKYFNMMKFEESTYFFIPVLLLFFKCWLTGGMFYWFFLINMNFFVFFIDLFFGVTLLFFGSLLFFFLKFSFYSYFTLAAIIFMRWKSNSGTSFSPKKMSVFMEHEFTWMEIFGGGGMFKSIEFQNVNMVHIMVLKIGILFMLVLFTLIFYIL